MWEYITMWHKAKFIEDPRWRSPGWDRWVLLPEYTDGPPPDATDSAALNHMGRHRWELIETDMVWDLPPGVTNTALGGQRRRYLFKRPLTL